MDKLMLFIIVIEVVIISGRTIISSDDTNLKSSEDFGIKGKGPWNSEEDFGVRGSGGWMSEEDFVVKGNGARMSEEDFGVRGSRKGTNWEAEDLAESSEEEIYGIPGKGVWNKEDIGSGISSNHFFN
ncbi:hypothetical protein ACHWQZ_G000680 [Mnemiopsis leidyi]